MTREEGVVANYWHVELLTSPKKKSFMLHESGTVAAVYQIPVNTAQLFCVAV